MTYISSLSLSAQIRQSVLQSQSFLAQAQAEISTGAPADIGLALGAGTGRLLSLRSQVDGLDGYAASNGVASTRLAATANTLTALLTTSQATTATLLTATTAGGDVDAMQASAQGALSSLVSGLNTTVAGESLFGGIDTGHAPLAPAATMQAAVASAFTSYVADNGGDPSAITATQMQSFLAASVAPMFSEAGWSGSLSTASSTTTQAAVSPTQTVATGVSANEGAFRQLAEGYSVLAALTGATSGLGAAAKASVAESARSLLAAGTAGLNTLQTGVGVAQQTVSAATTQNDASLLTLKGSAGNLDSVDVYALSSRVTTLQNQLEASYELTSRLKSLSLTTYLAG